MRKITKEVLDEYIKESIEAKPITGEPASLADLRGLEAILGVKLPAEVLEIYQIYNGIGQVTRTGGEYWSFHPLHEIVEFITDTRSYFSKTHPDLAKRFFPVFDWNTGDAVGFLMGEDGAWEPGIYEFEHDDYGFDAEQDGSVFLRPCEEECLADFLE